MILSRTFLIALVSVLLLSVSDSSLAKKKYSSLFEFRETQQGNIQVEMAWSAPVVYKGYYNSGDAVVSKPQSVMYQDVGVGAAGPAAQLIAQAIFTSAARKKKYRKAQEQADQVLLGYSDSLATLSNTDLFNLLKVKAREVDVTFDILVAENKRKSHYLKLVPEYTVAQNMASLILTTKVEVYSGKRSRKPLFSSDFIVVSKQMSADHVDEFWHSDNLQGFVDLSTSMFEQSVEMILYAMENELTSVGNQKTYKYDFDGKTRYERATLASYQSSQKLCEQLVLITIGGNLMSLPAEPYECLEKAKLPGLEPVHS